MAQKNCRREPLKAFLRKPALNSIPMKKLNVIIEQGADGFFAYVAEIDGCTSGGYTYSETKSNILSMIQVALNDDGALHAKYSKGYDVQFKISLEFVFKQFPELNIEGLAKETRIKQSVLKAIKDGTRMATEEEADTINIAIQALGRRLQAVRLTR